MYRRPLHSIVRGIWKLHCTLTEGLFKYIVIQIWFLLDPSPTVSQNWGSGGINSFVYALNISKTSKKWKIKFIILIFLKCKEFFFLFLKKIKHLPQKCLKTFFKSVFSHFLGQIAAFKFLIQKRFLGIVFWFFW